MARHIVILGAGGHAKVLVDILLANGDPPRACFARAPAEIPGVDVQVGADTDLMRAQDADARFVVGVGEMAVRAQLAALIDADGRCAEPVVHPSAIVSPSAQIEDGACVMPGAIVNAGARIGRHCVVNTGAIVEHDVTLRDGAFVGPGAVIAGGAHIQDTAMIGARAVLRPCVRVGETAMVGAGAVVVEDVPSAVCVAGTPAKRLRAA